MRNHTPTAEESKMKIFLRITQTVIIIILVLALAAVTVIPAALACIRQTVTNEFVYTTLEKIDYANVELPDGLGGFTTLADTLNTYAAAAGVRFSDEDFNKVFRELSLDTILITFAQDTRAWLFENAPLPDFNPDEMAQIVIDGLDGTIAAFLSVFFGSQAKEGLAQIISYVMQENKITDRLSALSPLRDLFSPDAVVFFASGTLLLFVLLLIACRRKIAVTLALSGVSAALSGAAMILADSILTPFTNRMMFEMSLPQSTFNIMYLPLIEAVGNCGKIIASVGIAAAAVFFAIAIIAAVVRKSAARKHNLHSYDVSDHIL